MKILLLERDLEEMEGITWYLKNYVSHDFEIHMIRDITLLQEQLNNFSPELIIIELELISTSIEALLKRYKIPIIAITAEPIFNQALKAIKIGVHNLFVKPLPLEELKATIFSLPQQKTYDTTYMRTDTQIYSDLYFNMPTVYSLQEKAFFLIECAHFENNLMFYDWLIQQPIFSNITALPLQKRIICLVHTTNLQQVKKQLRLLMQQWAKVNDEELNIALYDGEETTVLQMYNACKKALTLRFYNGYAHIFTSSQKIKVTHLDPLLSFEQQQLWITSLDKGDMLEIKQFLYTLSTSSIHYHHEDVRIHLTSILAQIRRYMKKYLLEEQAAIEKQYRALFHSILEDPVLYTIVQELILFTQLITDFVKQQQLYERADYTELAVSIIEKSYTNSELSLQMVANELNISANYLSTIFSEKRGIPFKKYVQQYRLQQAAEVILTTNYSIASIAEAVGFIDSNYFSKVFRAYYKTTPYRYRLQNKNTLYN